MAKLSKRANDRIVSGLKRFQPILRSALARDVNESDTVVIVGDLLQDVFGYDKYSEITSEHMIRSTYCDLAIKLENELALLVEVKAIGLDLKGNYVKQAVDYAANQGTDWVVLTNGIRWDIYSVRFTKPIEHKLVLSLNLLELNPRNSGHIDMLGLLAKEGWQKARLGEYRSQREALSRFVLGALITSDKVVDLIRRELRRISPDVKLDSGEVVDVLRDEVLKREVLEGDESVAAAKRVKKFLSKKTAKRTVNKGKVEGREPVRAID
jgi:hypothetical protein